jgi:hypothetical protein
MNFTPYSYWDVQKPQLLCDVLSTAVEFLVAIQILTPSALLLITWSFLNLGVCTFQLLQTVILRIKQPHPWGRISSSVRYLVITVKIICNKYYQWVAAETSQSNLQISHWIYNMINNISILQWLHMLADGAAKYTDEWVYHHGQPSAPARAN